MSTVPADNPINTTGLDTEFPVPGQDNDSQGFRDNFTVINDNAAAIKARLEDLEANGVRIDEANTFEALSTGGTQQLINPTIKSPREVVVDVSPSGGTAQVDFADGTYFKIPMTQETTISFTGTPDNGYYSRILLHITSTGDNNLVFSGSLYVGSDTDQQSFFNGTTTISSNEVHLVEVFTTSDGGEYFVKYHGNYSLRT